MHSNQLNLTKEERVKVRLQKIQKQSNNNHKNPGTGPQELFFFLKKENSPLN
jgi:hypothetical protein